MGRAFTLAEPKMRAVTPEQLKKAQGKLPEWSLKDQSLQIYQYSEKQSQLSQASVIKQEQFAKHWWLLKVENGTHHLLLSHKLESVNTEVKNVSKQETLTPAALHKFLFSSDLTQKLTPHLRLELLHFSSNT